LYRELVGLVLGKTESQTGSIFLRVGLFYTSAESDFEYFQIPSIKKPDIVSTDSLGIFERQHLNEGLLSCCYCVFGGSDLRGVVCPAGKLGCRKQNSRSLLDQLITVI